MLVMCSSPTFKVTEPHLASILKWTSFIGEEHKLKGHLNFTGMTEITVVAIKLSSTTMDLNVLYYLYYSHL